MKNTFCNSLSVVLYLLATATFGAACFLMWQHQSPLRHLPLTAEQTTLTAEPVPTHITISSQEISTPITPAYITSGQWETSDTSISLLSNPETINTSAGAILYGHNWNSLFGKLDETNIGDKVELIFSDSSKKTYYIQTKTVVHPRDVAALKEGDLILYTCTGFLDSKRLIVWATQVR